MSTESRKTLHKGANTTLAHGPYDPYSLHGFVNPPVVHASTVLFEDTARLRDRASSQYTYGLRGTPTTTALEEALDQLEGSAGTILVPSGLAAVTVPLLAFLSAGDHCLVVDSVYSPTRQFCNGTLRRMGVSVDYFDPHVGASIAELMRPETKVVFLESPGSNTFEMMDVAAVCEAAHAGGAVTMIDNTWATPLFFRPLEHGVDLSIHALTKYPGGHSDVMMGSVSATAETYKRLRATQLQLGINAAPDDTYLVLRGLKTMGVRLARHQASALELAEWLAGRPEVAEVLHPALPSFPGHALWKRQFSGSSGLFGFVLEGSLARANAFLDALELFGLGYSWGGHESLAVPVDLSDRTIATGPQSAGDGKGTLIRLQIGLEDVVDLRDDMETGFRAAAAV
ncbi:cystathionine beta-lyase [Aurantimonas sp. VKM B-3413]|uniref:cystathionine beta-lyase n=1 Tax=Aurantimonas sp. VKM B-3413 TaxID=2779401 RepID=UPI001E3D8DF9|nr:cystathionine beta-lyase [Aurantimonas sp. VKM B-3413]MCB8840107.1 cystathionine beta-lyase [Aurantimonas sp. VKM B-3413]